MAIRFGTLQPSRCRRHTDEIDLADRAKRQQFAAMAVALEGRKDSLGSFEEASCNSGIAECSAAYRVALVIPDC